ncbi:MAG: hypothetical protein GY950_34100, partial [bacterium]|nr:hypothetical protein [bacterium]
DVRYAMYTNYDKYNVLVDFIERIPIRQPETVIKLFVWVRNFEYFKTGDKHLYNSSFQSILELLAHAAKYAPDRYDYDALAGKLPDIPFDRGGFYDNLFRFFEKELKLNKKGLIDFVLEGIPTPVVNIENTAYTFAIKEVYRKKINEILESQEACSFTALQEINLLLERLPEVKEDLTAANRVLERLRELFERLPYAEISKEAPKAVRERVMTYSRKNLNQDLEKLGNKVNNVAGAVEIKALTAKLKEKYLLHQLNHYLLTLAYAVNAKNPKLKVFLNPNFVRLHNFEDQNRRTAWNYCGTPPATDYLSGFCFAGGLSRLHIVFAAKWHDRLFSRTFVHDSAHLQALILNLLDSYPVPHTPDAGNTAYNALMVDFGLELLRSAREKDNPALKREVTAWLSTITAGYHYRKAMGWLNGKYKEHDLFFSEIKQLAETFFKKWDVSKDHITGLTESTSWKQLTALKSAGKIPSSPPGNIYYRTFGNLTPQPFRLFHQDVATFFETGWVGGEMIDEFKTKLDWHLYKKKIPPILLPQVLQTFVTRTGSRFFSQNHPNDYFSTYFLFKIFNNSHLKG